MRISVLSDSLSGLRHGRGDVVVRTLALALALAILDLGQAAERSWATLEREFREVPMEARRLTGPLFWLHGDESRQRLEFYVGKVAEGGNGCFTAESRPHNDWLGEGWFRDLAICLEAAKKHDLKLWIFDEKWWPSGEVAGRVPAEFGSKRLQVAVTNLTGPREVSLAGLGGSNLVAILAGREAAGGIEGASLADLAGLVQNGVLRWSVPSGEWKVMTFRWGAHKSGSRYLLDGASADAVDWYLRTVYQPHYERFKPEFGRNIMGFFYDEPETHGDWGTEVQKVLTERGVDWKRALVASKLALAGEEQAAARYQYVDALAEAWGRTLYGGISRWCRERGVKSIGHFLEHGRGYLNPDLCAGNQFQLMKYSDMGGIDAVFDQFVWGQRVTRDAPVWQTPKLGSSITHAYGKPDDITMVEIFGARGQDLTYPEMKWWTDHMHVSGVNFHIPHSFNPRAPRDTDCPPYFYNGGFEPRWPLYRVYADYTSRLSQLLTGGRHVCPVALLYLGNSAHVGKHLPPEEMSEALQDALYDCDWLPYEVFERDLEVRGAQMRLRQETYRILVIPPVEVIPYATLAKARFFFDRGGIVLGYGFLPTRSATLGKTSADIAALRQAIWGSATPGLSVCRASPAGGRSYWLPEKPTPEQLQQVLTTEAGYPPTLEVLGGRTDRWLHVLHRVKAGRDVFFVVNQKHTGNARSFRLRIRASGVPECWDAMRCEITSIPYVRDGAHVELTLVLEPNESVLLVFAPQARSLPVRFDRGGRSVVASVPVEREAVPAPPEPTLEEEAPLARVLEAASWIWYPEGEPDQAAPVGTRWFQRSVLVPTDRALRRATFVGTADNQFVLYVNGQEAGKGDDSSEGWRNPVEIEVTARLRPGLNLLAVAASNGSDRPNPAGFLGCLRVEFEQGDPLVVPTDSDWKASRDEVIGWKEAAGDDAAWVRAKTVAGFGGGPWGRLRVGQLTLSPVKADPFVGRFELPASVNLKQTRPILELEELAPELAARVTVNDRYAGGVIGRPLRLDLSGVVEPGSNRIRIEPFAPRSVRVVLDAVSR